MRQLVGNLTLWVLDVIVAVFIGPVKQADKHGETIREIEARRRKYTFALCGVTLITIAAYTVIRRWNGYSF